MATVHHRDVVADALTKPKEMANGWPHRYRCVAHVDTDSPEEAFRLTNHIDHDWTENAKVLSHGPEPLRSSSIGDVVVTTAGPMLCCRVGWKSVYALQRQMATQ